MASDISRETNIWHSTQISFQCCAVKKAGNPIPYMNVLKCQNDSQHTLHKINTNLYKPKSIITGDRSSDNKIFAVLRSLWANGSGFASWNAFTPSQICRNMFNISDAFIWSLWTLRRSSSYANVPLWKSVKLCY